MHTYMHACTHTHTHTHTHMQGARNKAAFPPDVVDAYKYTFSQPGALTASLNYHRCMLPQREKTSAPLKNSIDVPTLIIWVSNQLWSSSQLRFLFPLFIISLLPSGLLPLI